MTAAARSARESTSVPSRSNATCSKARRDAFTRDEPRCRALGGEGRAAAAGVRGLRVRELEPAAVEVRDEVDLGPGEVLRARRVDDHADPVVLEDHVARLRGVVEVQL